MYCSQNVWYCVEKYFHMTSSSAYGFTEIEPFIQKNYPNNLIKDTVWTPLLGVRIYFEDSKPVTLGLAEIEKIILQYVGKPGHVTDWGHNRVRIFG